MGASLIATQRPDATTLFADNTTVNIPLRSTLNSGNTTWPWRVRGTSSVTISQLRTYVAANTTLVTSTLTARKNATNQSLAVSYTSGQTGEKQDTSNSFSASAGDDVDLEVAVPNDTSGAKTIAVTSITAAMTPSTAGETICRLGAVSLDLVLSTASVTRYMAGGGPNNASTTETGRRVEILSSFTLSHLNTYVPSNARTTTTTMRVRVNGANGNQSTVYTSGQTGLKEDTSNTDSVASGDDVDWSITTSTGTGNINLTAIDCIFLSSDEKFSLLIGTATSALNNNTTRYNGLAGPVNPTATEANAEARTFAATYTNLAGWVLSNTGNGTVTWTFRVEGADTALSIAWTTGQTGLKTDTDTVSAADDDRLSYKIVSTSTSGSTNVTWFAVTGYTASGSALNVDLSDSVTPSDALTKSLTLAKADTGNLADAVAKATALAKADSATTADALAKAPTLYKADSANSADALTKAVTLAKADTATPSDAVAKGLFLVGTDSATATDAIVKALSLARADTTSVVDALAKAMAMSVADAVPLLDAANARVRRIVRIHFYPTFPRSVSLTARFPRAVEFDAEHPRRFSAIARFRP